MGLSLFYNSVDYSLKWEDFGCPGYEVQLIASNALWIGYYKPISTFYIELKNKVSSTSKINIQQENSSGFFDVKNLEDRTFGLSDSGKISWDTDKTNQIKSTRNGKELYWYKLTVDQDTALLNIIGINTIFSYDSDLAEEIPTINTEKYLPNDTRTWIKFHMSSRKEIVQILRKRYFERKLLDAYDLLNIEEVRQAAKYLTLFKVCFYLSDSGAQDDKWRIKSKEFYSTFSNFINVATLSVDENDNGVADPAESNAIHSVRIVRE